MDFNAFLIDYFELSRKLTDWYLSNNSRILDILYIGFDTAFKVALVLVVLLTVAYFAITLFRLFAIRKENEQLFIESKAPTITIQIPTRNELVAINCAKRVLGSDYPLDKIQILIGDDSNQPEVSAQLKAFAQKNSKYVQVVQRAENIGYKPGNLNNMLKYSKGEFIVIFDSDFLPAKDFLPRLIAPFQYDKQLIGTQARWAPINSYKSFSSSLASSVNNMFHHIFLPFMQHVSGSVCFCGSAEAVRKSKLIADGGWQSGSLTEDIEYSLRLYRENKTIKYIYGLSCAMEVPFTPRDFFRQQKRWAFGVISALRQHFVQICKKSRAGLIFNAVLLMSGYWLTFLLFSLSVLGLFSIITHAPEPIDWIFFAVSVAKNIALTSGLLLTYIVAEFIAREATKLPRVLISSFSIGLIVILYVNKGIFNALTDRGMQWYLVKKHGTR